METDVYKTIASPSEGIYKEKGSRFIALAYPVANEEEIRTIISQLKEKYYDARHHCYAWRLGSEEIRFRANDDGEPSSTAGKPILGQLVSHDLTYILIVVIRYFGGIKLGVSGLTNAYREAAADALSHANIVEKTVNKIIRIQYSYLVMNDVMKIIKEENPEILERNFEMECEMVMSIRKNNFLSLKTRLKQIGSLSITEEKDL